MSPFARAEEPAINRKRMSNRNKEEQVHRQIEKSRWRRKAALLSSQRLTKTTNRMRRCSLSIGKPTRCDTKALLVIGLFVLVCATIQLDKTDIFISSVSADRAARPAVSRSNANNNNDGGSSRLSKCSQVRDAQMDACAARLGFLGDHSFRIADTTNAMAPFCSNLKDSIQCIQSYSKDCVNGLAKQILGTIMKRGKQQNSLICSTDSSKRDFINKMSCLSGDKIAQIHPVMDASIVRYELIASDKIHSDDKLPALCCSYQIFQRDMDSKLDKVCSAAKTKEFVRRIAESTAGELYAIICEGLRSMDDCQNSGKTSRVLRMLEDATTNVYLGKSRPTNKSQIPLLLRILNEGTPTA